MQDPVASGVEFINISIEGFRGISVEGFRLFTGIARDSVWGALGFLDTFWFLLRLAIYLIKNIHSYLC